MKQNNIIIELGVISGNKLIGKINKRNTDRVLRSEKNVDKILKETFELIKITKKYYINKDFSSDDLVNVSDYVQMLRNHLLDCRDKLNIVLYDLATEIRKELEEEK